MRKLRKMCKRCKSPTENQDGYCDMCKARIRSVDEARRIATAGTPYDTGRVVRGERRAEGDRGYDHAWQVFARDYLRRNPVCAICGRPARCVDHKVMPAQVMIDMYGKFILSSEYYQPLCISCNTKKAVEDRAKVAEYFRMKEELGD